MKNVRTASLLIVSFLLGLFTVSLMIGCSSDSGDEGGNNVPTVDNDHDADGHVHGEGEGHSHDEDGEAHGGEGEGHDDDGEEHGGDAGDTSQADALAHTVEWAQWGGSSSRNNVPVGFNIPIEFDVGDFNRETGEWVAGSGTNIRWVSRVGSQTYGNPVVADGKVFVGTNNSGGYLARYPSAVDLGCLLCFDEATGELLWQHSNEKLPTGRVHDWPLQGICSAPLIEGDRVWFVTSRGTVACVDSDGYRDGEDDGSITAPLARLFDIRKGENPETDTFAPAVEALNNGEVNDTLRAAAAKAGFELPEEVAIAADAEGKQWTLSASVGGHDRQVVVKTIGPKLSVFKIVTTDDVLEADTIWEYDMMGQLEVSQHNMCSCSVTALGDILFVNTSNGLDETHINLPSPDAPSFIAMDKNTGEVLWTDDSPAANILHGQWSSPMVAEFDGVPQVIFAGGDGWVYSFKADAGVDGVPELLWKFDANPKESKWILGGRGTRNNIIATPVAYDGLVYVAVGQDPEHGEGVGHLWCIDPNKRGDVSPELAINVETGDVIDHQRLQAVIVDDGQVARDNENSAVVWHYSEHDQDGDGDISFEETMHRSCGTVAIKDDILYIADFSGLFHCLNAKTGESYFTYDMFAAAWGSPLIVDGHVYIGDEDGDIAIFDFGPENKEPIDELNMRNSVYSTPIVANNTLYICNKTHLFAIAELADTAEAADDAGE